MKEEIINILEVYFPSNYENDKIADQILALFKQEIINELESNPNPDGSISPNIQHWIEAKQAQLRKLTPLK